MKSKDEKKIMGMIANDDDEKKGGCNVKMCLWWW